MSWGGRFGRNRRNDIDRGQHIQAAPARVGRPEQRPPRQRRSARPRATYRHQCSVCARAPDGRAQAGYQRATLFWWFRRTRSRTQSVPNFVWRQSTGEDGWPSALVGEAIPSARRGGNVGIEVIYPAPAVMTEPIEYAVVVAACDDEGDTPCPSMPPNDKLVSNVAVRPRRGIPTLSWSGSTPRFLVHTGRF